MTRTALPMIAALLAVAFLSQGCETQSPAAVAKAPAAPRPVAAAPPVASGDVTALQAAADRAENAARETPGDAALKEKAADADYQAGHAMMVSDTLDRKVKYRGALRYFRRALALSPGHASAAEEKDLIESIYRQMGRPIPQT